MNIAVFTDTYLPQINGVVTSTVTFAEEFERQGHNVYIFAPRVDEEKRSTEQVFRFRSVVWPGQKEHRLSIPWSRKMNKFEELEIDVIHAQTPFSMGYLAQIMGKRHQLPVIHTYHTFFAKYLHYVPLLPQKMMEKYAHYESKRFCNRCNHIVVPSTQMKEKLSDYGVTVPIDVIPTGINLQSVGELESRSAFRARYHIKNDEKLCIFVGRLGIEKNVYFLLQAFQKIKDAVPHAKLFIGGDGPEKADMIDTVQKQGLVDSVIFSGYLNRQAVFSAFQAADLCLFPSVTETQGLIVLESLACQTPVVCINAMGVRDVLANNQGGFLSEETVPDFVDKAIQLLTDTPLYEKKVSEAAARVDAFSSETCARKMLKVFQTAKEGYLKEPEKKVLL